MHYFVFNLSQIAIKPITQGVSNANGYVVEFGKLFDNLGRLFDKIFAYLYFIKIDKKLIKTCL